MKESLPEKILPYKTYNRIGHLSKSRLGEGDHFVDQKTEGLLTKQNDDPNSVIIVQEKLDGSNVCVVRWKGELRALGRSGYDCQYSNQEQHRLFHKFVMDRKDRFEKILPKEEDRVVGEWLALAHGTLYNLNHEPFVPFGLFEGQKELSFLALFSTCFANGFVTPIVLHIGGACSVNRALKLLNAEKYHGADNPEGVVYRMERPGKPPILAKLVKHDKEDGKFFKEGKEIWNWKR